jgi:hypothetical protein
MRRILRPLAALAMVALISVISAGCSNAPATTGAGSSGGNNTAPTASTGNNTAATDAPAGTATDSSGGNKTAATAASASSPESVASTGSSGGNTTTNRDQAVKFAECMRANGVREFPDPDASGQLTIDAIANGSSLDTNSAAFKQAISACKDLEPPGFTGGKRSPEQQKAALKFAQCVRDHGVKDFPDPAPDAPLVDTNRIPSAARPGGISILNAAMQKCGDFAAAAGVTGGK